MDWSTGGIIFAGEDSDWSDGYKGLLKKDRMKEIETVFENNRVLQK